MMGEQFPNPYEAPRADLERAAELMEVPGAGWIGWSTGFFMAVVNRLYDPVKTART